MRALVTCLRDPFNPGRREQRLVGRRRKISNLAPRTRMPVIAYHNGRVILRREWHRRVAHGDHVAFVVLPLGGGGGGGKNPLQLVLSLAMMAVSGPMATSLLGAELAGTIAFGEITFGRIVGGLISMVGNSIISGAFAGQPSNPSPQQMSGVMSAASPTYSLNAQGNMARLEAAIPVQYGRMMCYPDFAAQPYAEFAGNEQYLYQLLCLGQGEYEVESIRIEDTPISSFEEIDYEILGPGQSLTLFPSNVVTAPEVSGQLAEASTWLGGFIANAAGTTANAIAVDVVCPRGLYYANDSGGLSSVSVSFTTEARTVDSGGSPTGSWVALGTETLTAATNTPQRYSFRYTGLSGRYEVRLKRTSSPGGTTRYADDLNWAGLRAYLPETRTWAGQTLIALRMRASNNLSSAGSRKINVIVTRKLPIYDSGSWTAPQVTRSPAWAMADALRADYGGKLVDARIDIDQLVTLAATYAARGDTFDGRFDSTLTLWEAVQKIGQAVRTRPYLQGGIVHFARDEAASVPVALFSMRNIVRGSFSVDYLMPTEQTADAIDVAYFDSEVWSARRVAAALPDSSSLVPLKIDLFGVTGRDQACREGTYLAAVNRYRRKKIGFTTEMEGFIPSFGDLIAISHDMPAWGTSGEVTAVEIHSASQVIADWTLDAGTTAAADITGPDGATASRAFTDDSVVNWENFRSPAETVTAGASVSRTVFVKRDAVSSRFIMIRLRFDGGAGVNTATVLMRTDTAEYAASTAGGGTISVTIEAWDAAWWRVTVIAVAANSNTSLQIIGGPAAGATLPTEIPTVTGSVTFWTGTLTRLTLSEPVTFASGTHYIGLRTRNGGISGPYACTAGRTAYEVVVAGLLDFTPYTGGAEERTYFAFGKGETWRQPARVVAVRPSGLYQVEIEAINEDDSVHTADTGVTAPAAQYSNLVNLYTRPVVTGLTVSSAVGDAGTALVSWAAAPGAKSYVIDISSDGDTWSRAGETTSNNFPIPAVYGNGTLIRIAAVGLTTGPFVQVAYSAYSDYMWSAVSSTLMWNASSSTLMWSA